MSNVKKSNEQIRAAEGRVNAAKLRAATERDIERWKREDGIDDAQLGPPRLVAPGPDVRALRERLGLSQEAFAERFQLSLRTLQDWEQQRRVPEGPARVLLRVIEREPEAATRALAETAHSSGRQGRA